MICYEQPLNERVRVLLRLEFLFQQLAYALEGGTTWDTRGALAGLFDILNLLSRTELKAELLKELERQTGALGRLRDTAGVDARALDAVLDQIREVSEGLHRLDNTAIEAVRSNDFLTAVRQRSMIPGGTCSFDLPALFHWLQRDAAERRAQLDSWLAPLEPLRQAVDLILQLVRHSARATDEVARDGFFQRGLDTGAPSQMVRVALDPELGLYPEISGGRHRFSIRFLSQPDPDQRPVKTADDIPFRLTCCVI